MTLIQILNATNINANDNLMDHINIDDNILMLQHQKHNNNNDNNNDNNQYQINTNFITENLKRIMKKRNLQKYHNIRDIEIESNFGEILNKTTSSLNKTITKLSSLTTNTATTTTIVTSVTDDQQRLRQRRQLLSEIFDNKHNKTNKISLKVTTVNNNSRSNINTNSNTDNSTDNNDSTSSSTNSTTKNNDILSSSTISSTSTDPTSNTTNPSSSLIGRYVAGGTNVDSSVHNDRGRNVVNGATTIPTHTNRNIIGTGTTAIITNNKRPTIIIYPTVSPESIVIPIVSCILGFPLLALMVICCLRKRAKLARERDRRRNYDMQDHAVSLVRFSPIHRLNNRSSRVISLRPERSLSRGFPSLELDTVVEERSSDHEQTQTDILSPESPSDPQKYRGFNSS